VALQLCELDVEDFDGLAILHQLVPLGEAKQAQDLFRSGVRTTALLEVER
jgi:hypothetical protein